MRRLLASALALAALVVRTLPAFAYCRATTCPDVVACDGQEPTRASCMPLRWNRSCVGYSVVHSDGKHLTDGAVRNVAWHDFQTWTAGLCDGKRPSVYVRDMGIAECGHVEYNLNSGNMNAIIVQGRAWPHKKKEHNLALTTLTFDHATGEIYDADFELNAAQYELSTDSSSAYDLVSVLMHEAGHFFGLGHSEIEAATMSAEYNPTTLDFRSLSLDDREAICAVYPPADVSTCDPTPRHGFSTKCGGEVADSGGCSFRRDGTATHSAWAAMVIVLAGIVVRRRRAAT